MTNQELKERLKIVIDTREKSNSHITNEFEVNNIQYEKLKLDYGDYTAKFDERVFADEIWIEKKNSIDEICGNFGKRENRERFAREFERSKGKGYLLIEESNLFGKIDKQAYRSQITPNSLKASIIRWCARYNLSLIFCSKKDSAELIYDILFYHVAELLKKEEQNATDLCNDKNKVNP